MLNSELHLSIFEGEAETKYVEKLERNFLGKNVSVKCVYDTEIYQLYKKIKEEDFIVDVINILKERSKKNAEVLKDYNRESFAAIYLFFDYDAHSSIADDKHIVEMLDFFDNETENGMLYLSYPMVEAIRHYKDMDSFKGLTAKCKRGNKYENVNCPYKDNCEELDACLAEPHYKTLVPTDCRTQLTNINSYNLDVWEELIRAHVFKMNYLVNDKFSMPERIVGQSHIFNQQFEKHINHKCPKVAVLSAFPIYVLDYYGVPTLKKKLGIE